MLRVLPLKAWTALQWVTLLFELEAIVLLCWRPLRPWGMLIGLGMHLMIALMMKDLVFFSVQMAAFYALFLTADEWLWILAWEKKLVNSNIAIFQES